MRRVAPLLLSMIAAGCSLAPHYERPSIEAAPAAYRETADWKVATPSDSQPRGRWWTAFGDPSLDTLESRVTSANQDLRAALARLQQARAQTRIARAGYFPTLDADANARRSKISENGPSFVAGKSLFGDDFDVGGTLSYEFDLFGRVRNTVAGARAGEQATAGDLAVLDLSVRSELASDYFALRGLDSQQQLLDRTVADYTKALQLTRNLYQGGAAALADVQQATAQLETARAQADDTRLRRAQTEHAVAVLVGESPSTFHLDPVPLASDIAPPAIDPGLPSQLLERRPDVAAAERRVASANAAIGVARAAYFPLFSLAAAMGLESVASSNWTQAPSRYWSVGPQGVLTIFDAGAHRAQSAAAHAAYDEQVANYRRTVLVAFQEVEDDIAALRELERESVSQAAAVAATQGALDQANFRYKGGIVTYLEVVSTENAALAARLAQVDVQMRRIAAAVQLVKALGGDWSVDGGPGRSP